MAIALWVVMIWSLNLIVLKIAVFQLPILVLTFLRVALVFPLLFFFPKPEKAFGNIFCVDFSPCLIFTAVWAWTEVRHCSGAFCFFPTNTRLICYSLLFFYFGRKADLVSSDWAFNLLCRCLSVKNLFLTGTNTDRRHYLSFSILRFLWNRYCSCEKT